MAGILSNPKGEGNLGVIIALLIIGGAIYVGAKLADPYYANMDLEKKMRYWGNYDLRQGSFNFPNLKNVQDTIDTHGIPLNVEDIKVNYDKSTRVLTITADYDVYVQFPGYEYYINFAPYVEIQN